MNRKPPELPQGYFGPPYFEIHAEGLALIAATVWLLVILPAILWFH